MAYEIAAGIILAYIINFLFELGSSFLKNTNDFTSGWQKLIGWAIIAIAVIMGLSILIAGLSSK